MFSLGLSEGLCVPFVTHTLCPSFHFWCILAYVLGYVDFANVICQQCTYKLVVYAIDPSDAVSEQPTM